MQDWPRKSEQLSYGGSLLQGTPRDPKLPWLLFHPAWPRLPSPVGEHQQGAAKWGTFPHPALRMQAHALFICSTIFILIHVITSVKVEYKTFQNGYDSYAGIRILFYSVQIPSTCKTIFKTLVASAIVWGVIQIASILTFCSIFLSLSMLAWLTHIYIFSPRYKYYILKGSLSLLEEPPRKTNSNQYCRML